MDNRPIGVFDSGIGGLTVVSALKKILPNKLISFRQDFMQIKKIRSDEQMNWFVNNTGDNCYIRGILKKK